MAGVVKDVIVSNVQGTTLILTASFDTVIFGAGWVVLLDEVLDKRTALSWGNPAVQKIVVSPKGVAYPGDAIPGEGSKKLTLDFTGTPPTIVMTQVEIDLMQGWLIVYKGDHFIAYNPSAIDNAIVESFP